MIAAVLLYIAATLQAAPPAASPSASAEPSTIVVNGVRMEDLRAAVQNCAAGHCSVRGDVIASVRLAEALFREGDYRGARDVLGRAVSRNEDSAAADPLAVSELYLARANVAQHYGDQREQLRAAANSARVLRTYQPDTIAAYSAEARLIAARIRNGQLLDAERSYASLADRARAAGNPAIAVITDMRLATLLHRRQARDRAERVLAGAEATPGISDALRLQVMLLRARLAAEAGDPAPLDRLVDSLSAQQRASLASRGAPALIYSPPLPSPLDSSNRGPFEYVNYEQRSSSQRGLGWVDIGFVIAADGSVESAEILRGSRGSPDWAVPVLSTVSQRRYAAAVSAGDQGSTDGAVDSGRYRIERYTLTADFVTPIGSFIRRRGGAPRIEQIDLTPNS